jgi:membrane-bound metal-dependent hydrolase YbcI (DUF457 family)
MLNKIVDFYLSISNHFGTTHVNWFDFTMIVLVWSILIMLVLYAFHQALKRR